MLGIDTLETLTNWVRTHYFGKYAGKIVDTDDPLTRGRLKVEVPAIYGDGVSVWALPCVPYAGDGIGFKSLPPVGSNVWVEFEAGDISYPIWSGFFWGDGEMPSEAGSGDNIKLWKTGAITIQIDDEAGEIMITVANGATLTLSTTIEGEAGNASLTVDPSSVTADAGGKLEVTTASVRINNGSFEVS